MKRTTVERLDQGALWLPMAKLTIKGVPSWNRFLRPTNDVCDHVVSLAGRQAIPRRRELNLASLITLSWSAPGVATPSDHIPTASWEPPDGGTHGAVALANATLMPVCGCALVVNYGMLAISTLSVHRRRQSAPKSPTRLKPHSWLSKSRSHALSSPSTHTPDTNVPAHA